MGTRLYGVCVTFYEKIETQQLLDLKEMIEKWRLNNLIPSDFEYIEHIQDQLKYYNDVLFKAKTGMLDHLEDLVDVITDADEKSNLYSNAMGPLKKTVLVETDNVYVPKCIGVLSHWPWHDLLKDWLCGLVRLLQQEPNTPASSPKLYSPSMNSLLARSETGIYGASAENARSNTTSLDNASSLDKLSHDKSSRGRQFASLDSLTSNSALHSTNLTKRMQGSILSLSDRVKGSFKSLSLRPTGCKGNKTKFRAPLER